MKDSLGDRMKLFYENRYKIKLPRRIPVIMRLDGKAFHTFTKGYSRPFSDILQKTFVASTLKLLDEIQGAKCAYLQSDEISILITDFDRLETDAWFDYNIQKMVSVSSVILGVAFNNELGTIQHGPMAYFDSRVFSIPVEEVANYFIWRQQDWERNSLQMLCRSIFSHKQLENKKKTDMHEMLHENDINWTSLEDRWKNGTFITRKLIGNRHKFIIEDNCPIFKDTRGVFHELMYPWTDLK